MSKKLVAASVLCALVTIFWAAMARSHHVSTAKLNPKAPPETAQFHFLIGEWECKTIRKLPDGRTLEGKATWKAYYILDGWAIQDDWTSTTPEGEPFHGTNIRSYDVERKKWTNRWLHTASMRWKHFDAEQKGDTMVMIGGEGQDSVGQYVDRNTFYNISKNQFDWKKDRSYDGGQSWVERVTLISAERISS